MNHTKILKIVCIILALGMMIYFIGEFSLPGKDRYLYYSLDAFQVDGCIVLYQLPSKLGGRMYITNNNGEINALIGRDPYDKCLIIWDKTRKVFKSTCKDSIYSISGQWLSGPSKRNLGRFAITQQDDVLVVDTGTQLSD